jgi:hypothetical protein
MGFALNLPIPPAARSREALMPTIASSNVPTPTLVSGAVTDADAVNPAQRPLN